MKVLLIEDSPALTPKMPPLIKSSLLVFRLKSKNSRKIPRRALTSQDMGG